MLIKPSNLHQSKTGFTIVELMIATVVFSLVLMLLVFGTMRITRVYYQGLNQSKIQNTTRNIMDTISGAIRFGGSLPVIDGATGAPFVQGTTRWFCVGDQIFAYKLGFQIDGTVPATQTDHALVIGTLPTASCPSLSDTVQLTSTGITSSTGPVTRQIEQLGSKMRLSELKLGQSALGSASNSWQVTVQVSYGDDDLLCNPVKQPTSCTDNASMSTPDDFTNDSVICKLRTATQFCAYSRLNTIAQTRIEPGGG